MVAVLPIDEMIDRPLPLVSETVLPERERLPVADLRPEAAELSSSSDAAREKAPCPADRADAFERARARVSVVVAAGLWLRLKELTRALIHLTHVVDAVGKPLRSSSRIAVHCE